MSRRSIRLRSRRALESAEHLLALRLRLDRVLRKVIETIRRHNCIPSLDELLCLCEETSEPPCLAFALSYFNVDTTRGGFPMYFWLVSEGSPAILRLIKKARKVVIGYSLLRGGFPQHIDCMLSEVGGKWCPKVFFGRFGHSTDTIIL